MKPAILLTPIVPWLALLASCSSPPKPPTVDEARKRPVNTAAAVELQVCKADLENTRLRSIELRRLAEGGAAATAARAAVADAVSKPAVTQHDITALTQAIGRLKLQPEPTTRPNSIATVRFDYGSTRVEIHPASYRAILKEAKAAPLILLRGRTDGTSDDPAEGRIARARAAAVADYLISAGLRPSQIRTTYQPTGDHAADNRSLQGRAQNRRVEIEIYSAMPVALDDTEPGDAKTR